MTASEELGSHLCDELGPLGDVWLRRMFGKTGVFCDGVMFAMIADGVLYLRVDDGNRDAFAEAAVHPPLSYVKRGETIDLSFWRAPDRLFGDDDHDELIAWCGLAVEAARRVAAKRRPRTRRPL
ncbi:MAG: TfoX/Sxy family protein [Ilumatobacteraceae bacterium]